MHTGLKISILGCGWLGFPLAQNLISDGYKVKGSTTSPDKLKKLAEAGIEPYLIHLADVPPETLHAIFDTDVVIICFPPKVRSGNGDVYLAHINLLAKVIRQSSVKHLIFISSTSVYPDNNSVVTEDAALATTHPAQTLVQAEYIMQDLAVPATIIRFAGLIDHNRHPGRFFAGKPDVPNPSGPVNLIHLEDCIQIIRQIIIQHKYNQVYNACSDHHPSRQEFYMAATAALGLPLPTFAPPTPADTYKIISSEKLKKDLNYRFIYPDPMLMKELQLEN